MFWIFARIFLRDDGSPVSITVRGQRWVWHGAAGADVRARASQLASAGRAAGFADGCAGLADEAVVFGRVDVTVAAGDDLTAEDPAYLVSCGAGSMAVANTTDNNVHQE